ncbi:MAG: glycosyltransferase family 39 protein [Pyrinomonadaceae bacterium]|nr:glycosyltransferase family 39 protein [Pyrinomonadaceae bacterium]MCX7639011.1 glycosyltransferase family 39 protein [Pyrinomonadaceae bacterium]MDW8303769.1 glycosyltransferase family 39 protein [Acidobacteriota bacterium]
MDKIAKLIIPILIVSVYFVGLSLPLIGPDEPRYAQVAREMFQRSDLITPTLGGFEWFEKPPLLYWLQMLSYKMFGVSEFSARLGSTIFGLLTILSLSILVKITTNDAKLTRLVALILSTSIGLIVFAHGASFDIILTFPITASLSSFFIAFYFSEHEKIEKALIALFVFYFFMGVSVLAKGLVGLVIGFGTIFLFFILARKIPPKSFFLTFPFGILICVLVMAIWYLPMYQLHGWRFVDEFIIQHHFERYTSNKYLHPQPFWFFWLVLPIMTIPWTPFFLASIWDFLKNFREKGQLEVFAFSWMITLLVFFSFSGSKLPGYILPALPAAAFLTAKFIFEKRVNWINPLASVTALLVIVFGTFFAEDVLRHETTKHFIEKADRLGYKDAKILNLHTISHNLEFYGAGRLVRETNGKQRYFYGSAEVEQFMRLNGEREVLVIVPPRYENDLIENTSLKSEKLDENNEYAFFVVKLVE